MTLYRVDTRTNTLVRNVLCPTCGAPHDTVDGAPDTCADCLSHAYLSHYGVADIPSTSIILAAYHGVRQLLSGLVARVHPHS